MRDEKADEIIRLLEKIARAVDPPTPPPLTGGAARPRWSTRKPTPYGETR